MLWGLCDSKVGNDALDGTSRVVDVGGVELASGNDHLEVGKGTVDSAGVWRYCQKGIEQAIGGRYVLPLRPARTSVPVCCMVAGRLPN